MSWGASQPGQNPYYQGQQAAPAYGQQAPPPAGGYGQPPRQQYGQAPAGYGQQAPPPQHGGYNAGGASAPPSATAPGYGGAPPPGSAPGYAATGYRAPPPTTAPGYGGSAPPPAAAPGYRGNAPPPAAAPGYGGGAAYGAPPGGAPYGAPPGGSPYGAPPGGAPYGAPPGPPPGMSPDLWHWFQSVDTDRSGKINSAELQQALMNGNWTPFNPETCRLMIGMFDKDKNGQIDVNEFSALWKYIQDWKACFDRFDTDRSGNIDINELQNAFKTFGYNLSMNFCNLCVRTFDRRKANTMNFDDFIQCCVLLKSLTDKFKEKDTQQSGSVRIHYEEFLRMVLDTSVAI